MSGAPFGWHRSASSRIKAGSRIFRRIEDFEDCGKLGDLQQVAHTRRKIRQLDRSVAAPCRSVKRHEDPDAGAIDIRNLREIQDDIRGFGQKLLDVLTKGSTFVAEHDAANTVNNRDITQVAGCKLKRHNKTSGREF